MGKNLSTEMLFFCFRKLMRPVARFALRNSLKIQDALESLKIVFIEVAAEELRANEQKVNVSRLATATGIHRRDIMRIFREGETKEGEVGLFTKVIGMWRSHKDYTTSAGKPRVLSCDGFDSEFAGLVRYFSQDLYFGTILFELERVGLVERTPRGVKLKSAIYDSTANPEDAYRMLAQDTEAISLTIEENVFEQPELPQLHIRNNYDNIRVDDLPKIRRWLLEEGGKFQNRVERFLSRFDQDNNPKPNKEGGGNIVVTVFSHIATPEER
jgi:hypothetical protein